VVKWTSVFSILLSNQVGIKLLHLKQLFQNFNRLKKIIKISKLWKKKFSKSEKKFIFKIKFINKKFNFIFKILIYAEAAKVNVIYMVAITTNWGSMWTSNLGFVVGYMVAITTKWGSMWTGNLGSKAA